MWEQPDTPSYANGAKLLFGFDGEVDRLQRLTKPLSLVFPAILYALFGLETVYGLWVQELIAYFACGLLMFHILHAFVANRKQAYWGTIAYMLCQPMAIFGVLPMIDALGWAISLGGILLSIQVLNKSQFRFWRFHLIGWYLGIGFFAKESIITAGAFLFLSILLEQDSFTNKFKRYLAVGLGFIPPILLISAFTHYQYGVSFLTWLSFNHTDPVQYSQPIKAYLTQSFRALDLYWLLVTIGALVFLKQCRDKLLSRTHMSFVLTGFICLLVYPFVWPYYFDRIIFMFAPFFMLLVCMSLDYIQKLSGLTILLAGVSNLLLTYGIYAHQMNGLIVSAVGGYAVFLLGILIYNWKFRN